MLTEKDWILINLTTNWWFLGNNPEWNNDKEVVLKAVKKWKGDLQYASNELRNDKEVVLSAVKKDGLSLKYASDKLKNDKQIVLKAFRNNTDSICYIGDNLRKNRNFILNILKTGSDILQYSTLEGYQDFDEIVKKEGEGFLFSCWNNIDFETRLRVANHPNYLPTLKQIKAGLNDNAIKVKEVYQLRQDEWISKMEENKLKDNISRKRL